MKEELKREKQANLIARQYLYAVQKLPSRGRGHQIKYRIMSDFLGKLKQKGFIICRSVNEDPFGNPSPDNIFEFYSMSVIESGNINAVLCCEFFFNTEDKDYIFAYVMHNMQYDVLPSYKLTLIDKKPTNKTYFYLRELFEDNGDHKRAMGIMINFPVIGYVSDKQRQDWYFNNPANKNKTLDDFIAFAEDLFKGGKVSAFQLNEPASRKFNSKGLEAINPSDVIYKAENNRKPH